MAYNGVIHYESDIHVGASETPKGRHDYDCFETASQFPDGLIVVKSGDLWCWDLWKNTWEKIS